MKSKKSILKSACSMAPVLSNAVTLNAADDLRTIVNIRADLSKIYVLSKESYKSQGINL